MSEEATTTTTEAAEITPAPGALAESPLADVFDSKGGFAEGWADKVDNLPEDNPLRAHTDFFKSKNFPDINAVLSSYVGLNQKLGKSASADFVKVLGEDASAEDISAYRQSMGIPLDAEGYGLEKPEGLPEGVEWNEEQGKEFAALLHKNNAPPGLAKDLVEWEMARQSQALETQEAAYDAAVTAQVDQLKSDWGADYGKNLDLAKRAAREIPGFDMAESPLASNAEFIKAMHHFASIMSEDKIAGASAMGASSDMERARAIQTDKNNPYHERYVKGDPAVKKMVEQLHANAAAG